MKLLKRCVLFVLIVGLQLSMFNASYGAMFPDVDENAWYKSHVDAVVEAGIIIGNSKGEFMPAQTLNVDQFVKTMVVALGYKLPNGESYWASTYMDKAREIGLIGEKEYPEQAYSSQPISRAEMSKMIIDTLVELEGEYAYSKTDAIRQYIPDIDDVSDSPYEAYILQVYELGIITGDSSGAFKPNNTLTRAEAATVLHRIIDKSIRKPYVQSTQTQAIETEMIEFDDSYYKGITIYTTQELGAQYRAAKTFLIPIVGEDSAEEIIEYAKTKADNVPRLDAKFWELGNIKVRVVSQPYNPRVVIDTWEFK